MPTDVSDAWRSEGADTDGADRAQFAGSGYIAGFDGLRAISVLLVLIAHAGYGKLVPGGFGVTVFFTISGYLITTLLIQEYGRTGTLNLRRFYVRRFLRLYPELVALVFLCLVSAYFLPFKADLTEKLAGLFYYMNYYYVFGRHYPEADTYQWRQLWSLSVEEHFYFIFPALILLVATKSRRLAAVFFILAAPLLWRFVTYYKIGLPWQYNYVATDTRIDSIAWGCMLALLMHNENGVRHPTRELCFLRGWLVPVALALIVFTLVYRDEAFRWTWRFTLQGIGITLVIANLLFDPRWKKIVGFLELRAVRYIGRISYGLYLYHMLFNRYLVQLWPSLPRPLFLVLSIITAIVVATLSYLMFEVPLKALRRRFGSHVR